MPDLPVVCTLGPRALATRREGLLADLFQITVEPAGGPISLELTGPHGTKEFVAALLPS